MKLNKFLSITLLAGALMLSACGSKGKDNSKNNDESGSVNSTPAEPVYTVTADEYSSLIEKLISPKIFIEGNFTFDLTTNGEKSTNKIANGKFDGYNQGEHGVLDLQVDTYNDSTETATGRAYFYDEDDGWVSNGIEEINVGQFHYLSLGAQLSFVPPTLDIYTSFTYNEDARTYTGTIGEGEYSATCTFMFKNKQFLSLQLESDGETVFKFEFYDYGTTTVTIPEVTK